jgi:hypothetical protein
MNFNYKRPASQAFGRQTTFWENDRKMPINLGISMQIGVKAAICECFSSSREAIHF